MGKDLLGSLQLNRVYQMDCLEGMRLIPDKSINLVIIDPPYNIKKDKWDNIHDYIDWMGTVFQEIERILKNNGTLYWFQNDIHQAIDLYLWLKGNSELEMEDLCVWNKWNGFEKGNDRQGFYYKVFCNKNLHTLPKLTEYFFRYTKGNLFSKLIKERMIVLKLKEMDFRKLKLSKNGNPTGWCSNIINGKNIPTKEDWNLICKLIGDYGYESLSQTFNVNDIKNEDYSVGNIFNINIPNSSEKVEHPTQKPKELIEKLIKLSSNEGDVVLDCFMGSGTTAVSSVINNRKWIGFEKETKYIEIANKRIDSLEE